MAPRKKKQVHVEPPQAYIDMWDGSILKLESFNERMRYRKEWTNKHKYLVGYANKPN